MNKTRFEKQENVLSSNRASKKFSRNRRKHVIEETHSHPIKSLALLFLHQKEANGSEKRNIKKVSFLLLVYSHYILQ